MPSHLDIVEQQYDLHPPDTTSAEGILAFAVRVCHALPALERWGLHAKPAGENIAYYAPADKMVGISRVMQPSGALVKILSDAGVGGTNRPAWNDEEPIEASRWVEVTGSGPEPPDPPVPDPNLGARIAVLEAQMLKVKDDIRALVALDAALEKRVSTLEQAPPYELPALVAEGETSRVWGHAHRALLPVKPK